MDIVDQIDLICSETGLDDTSQSQDRVKALACWNRAYRRVTLETKCIKTYGKYIFTTPGQVELKLADFGATETLTDASAEFSGRFMAADYLWLLPAESADRWHPGGNPLVSAPLDRVLASRGSSASDGPPSYYTIRSGRLHLDSAPSVADGSGILIYGALSAPTLDETNVEDDVLGVNPVYHEDLICALASCYALEGYEGQEQRASYYRSLHKETMRMFKDDQIREASLRLPNDGIRTWDTPSNLRQR
jgi:hypothetical protein